MLMAVETSVSLKVIVCFEASFTGGGTAVDLVTDHKPLECLYSKKSRLPRPHSMLRVFDYTIEYKLVARTWQITCLD